MTPPRLGVAWYEAVCAAGRVHGEPLPKEVVRVEGDRYRFRLNPTAEDAEGLPPFTVVVNMGDGESTDWMPTAVLGPSGGGFLAPADENEFIEWCKALAREEADRE